MVDFQKVVSRFGVAAKAKLTNPGATGEPEDQLRAPLETLFGDLAELCGLKRKWLAAVGESSLSTLKTRPDYAITLRKVLVGYVEVKAPGKGADPQSRSALGLLVGAGLVWSKGRGGGSGVTCGARG